MLRFTQHDKRLVDFRLHELATPPLSHQSVLPE
jgi:hypothetical protein